MVLAGECKFKSEKFGKEDYENFMEKIQYLPGKNIKAMLFSLSGFTEYVVENARDCKLVSLDEMYK